MFKNKRTTKGTKIRDQALTKKNASTRSFVDAIIVSNFEQADSDLDSEEIHDSAKKEIEESIRDVTIDRISDPIRWGNSRGLGVSERLDVMQADIQRLKGLEVDVKGLKSDYGALKSDYGALKSDVEALKISSESYLKIRSRFFAVFLRDKIQKCSGADYNIIKEGNITAHRGDPLVDAELYKQRIRSDDKTFQILYGMSWGRVLEYASDKDVLRLLEAHASALAESPKPIGNNAVRLQIEDRDTDLGQLEACFAKFVNSVEHEGYRANFLQDPMAPETLAYWEFWKQHENYQQPSHNTNV